MKLMLLSALSMMLFAPGGEGEDSGGSSGDGDTLPEGQTHAAVSNRAVAHRKRWIATPVCKQLPVPLPPRSAGCLKNARAPATGEVV